MAQPLAEETIELKLFIRLVHARVRIAVAPREMPLTLEVGDFGHAYIVIEMHAHPRGIDDVIQHASLGNRDHGGIGRALDHLEQQGTEVALIARQGKGEAVTCLGLAEDAREAQIIGPALGMECF